MPQPNRSNSCNNAIKVETRGGSGAIYNACAVLYSKTLVLMTEYWKKVVSFVSQTFLTNENRGRSTSSFTYTSMVDQGKKICRDCIYQKLFERNLSRKLTFGGDNTTLSEAYTSAVQVLQKLHPMVYTDVSRKIGRTMTSPGIVKAILGDVLEIMFRESISWGKVVSMFLIAGCFAEECVQQGHPDFVKDVVDTVGGFVAMRLVEWLEHEGGWDGLDQVYRDKKDQHKTHYVFGLFGAFIGLIAVTLLFIVEMK